MIVTKENQRMYPKASNYNFARILTQLSKIVTNNGGRVKPTKKAIISDRTLNAAIEEYREKIERYTELEKESHNPNRSETIKNYAAKLEKLTSINNEPISVTHTSYISFVLDDVFYYYQVDSNPFFPFYYTKTPVINGKYSLDACSEEDKKEWLFDCFFYSGCSDADIVEAANLIYNMLVNAQNTRIIRYSRKQRVPNTYNSGYHYETIYSPERIKQLDF